MNQAKHDPSRIVVRVPYVVALLAIFWALMFGFVAVIALSSGCAPTITESR